MPYLGCFLAPVPRANRAAYEELTRISASMARLTADPRMQFGDRPPVFDGTRLIAAGFKPMGL